MTKARGFYFTDFNYTEARHAELIEKLEPYTYLIIGKETCPETQTRHYQCYVHFKNPRSIHAVRKLLHPNHVDIAKGSAKQNFVYCSKEGDFEEYGKRPLDKHEVSKLASEAKIEKNKRLVDKSVSLNELVQDGTLSPYQVCNLKRARDILAQESDSYTPKGLRGLWICGPPGCGKTRMVHEVYGESLYLKPQSKWWDGYRGEKTVLLDDLDVSILGHYMKIWSDRYACNGEVKGSSIVLRHELFIVTTNYRIEELFSEPMLKSAIERRFELVDCFEDPDVLKQFYEK